MIRVSIKGGKEILKINAADKTENNMEKHKCILDI